MNESEIVSEFQVKTKVKILHLYLSQIKIRYSAESKRRLGERLWKALPAHVAVLDLGEQIFVKRSAEQLKFIPLGKRETWNLERIDLYGSMQARSISENWKPVFPPQQSSSDR